MSTSTAGFLIYQGQSLVFAALRIRTYLKSYIKKTYSHDIADGRLVGARHRLGGLCQEKTAVIVPGTKSPDPCQARCKRECTRYKPLELYLVRPALNVPSVKIEPGSNPRDRTWFKPGNLNLAQTTKSEPNNTAPPAAPATRPQTNTPPHPKNPHHTPNQKIHTPLTNP
jgi:hypothetical protein